MGDYYLGLVDVIAEKMTWGEYTDKYLLPVGKMARFADGFAFELQGVVNPGTTNRMWMDVQMFNRLFRKPKCMHFSLAMETAGKGIKIRRKKWTEGDSLIQAGNVFFRFMMVDGEETTAPYTPSPEDTMADDWEVLL